MSKPWTRDEILDLAKAYQPACVLAAAAEWDVFSALGDGRMTAQALAARLGTDPRATGVLLDALAAQDLLLKEGREYWVPTEVAALLTETGSESVLSMVWHQGNCLARWVQLARVVQSGRPAERVPSVRGAEADRAAFLEAMDVVSGPAAGPLVAELGPLKFRHLLDVGGASGTWTIAFLQAAPEATATIFDLPDAIPPARRRLADAGLLDRVTLVGGDFYVESLPTDADLVWLSAIAHQNSRAQNRDLFAKVHRVLDRGGSLLLRDVVMEESRTKPLAGAFFAINMLVATEGGGTYSLREYGEDLAATGFTEVTLLRPDQYMNTVIRARKP